MELRGKRNGPRSMRVHQRIYRKGGGHIDLPTNASLHFTDVGAYFGGSYWKVHQLAHFELWSVGRHHRLLHRVRTGPKLNYCLRDLERTRPGRRSPSHAHYPGCNQNPYQDQHHPRHLGRLVGHLPSRLRQAVDSRRRTARLLRLRHARRPQRPVLRVKRERQHLPPPRPPSLPRRRRLLTADRGAGVGAPEDDRAEHADDVDEDDVDHHRLRGRGADADRAA